MYNKNFWLYITKFLSGYGKVRIAKIYDIFKFVIIMQKVDESAIQRELQRLNIPYDMNIIKEVYLFLDKFIGPLSNQDAQYHIPAACAIICQTIKIPTVGSTTLTSTGIKIENVMRHIGSLSKQKFLETVQIQIKKSDYFKHSLVQKVGNIKIAFRVFKKYKTIFENLSMKNKIPFNVNHQLLAFFWIVFLIAKINLQALENLNFSTKILVYLIEEVFCNYYSRDSRQRIHDFICQKDNFAELSKISEQQQTIVKSQIYNIMSKVLKSRDPSSSPNCNNLLENQNLLSRVVDDLNSQYDKLYQALPEGRFIDQMTFLELTKNLTPQAFVFKTKQQPISKIISFDDDDQEQDEDQMKDTFKTEGKKPIFAQVEDSSQKSITVSLFSSPTFNCIRDPSQIQTKSSKSITDLTPVSLGHSKSTWAQNFIEKFDSSKESVIKIYFQNKKVNFDSFVQQIKQKIKFQVDTLTPYILNKQKTIIDILKMSFSFTSQLLILRDQTQLYRQSIFNALLCISAFLYNSATRYLSLELQKYCQVYQANIMDCLNIIYQMSEHLQLPLLIRQMLSQLEKQVLIKQIWDTDIGFQLLREGKIKSNQTIFNRLERRIFQRIKQICVAIKIDLSQVQKIEALVKEILNKKPQILMKNKLDQIIICSTSACLNLNQAKYNLALSTIFQKYNSISLSLNSNRQMLPSCKEQQTVPQSLLEFYNRVFIHEVQQMMSRQQNPRYLYTPIRENHLRKLKDESGFAFPLVASTLANRDGRPTLGGQGPINSYQKQILQKMKEKQKAQSQGSNSQSQHSPCFGTGSVRLDFSFDLKRKFTFGPNNSSGN